MARRTLVLDQPVESSEATKKKSRKGIFVGIALLAIVPIIGTTFALNINVNNGNPVEFGQGSNAVTACDQQITLTPVSAFAGSAFSPSFSLGAINMSDVDLSSGGCQGKTFKIVARQANGEPSSVSSTYTFTVNSSGTPESSNTGLFTVESLTGAGTTSGAFTLNISGGPAANDISLFTTETS
jgi:hypothetical protein